MDGWMDGKCRDRKPTEKIQNNVLGRTSYGSVPLSSRYLRLAINMTPSPLITCRTFRSSSADMAAVRSGAKCCWMASRVLVFRPAKEKSHVACLRIGTANLTQGTQTWQRQQVAT
ncbi:hypothetical protein Vafri_2507 [Volvox africanus]|uniref:Uncharacterized protein n=1 Tax=Volvox africanus TaxID=51714 RepID=A0A8J4ETN3_9CHLO|nr:hypothetical protein Vafri_2507 [Volvox africanus]